MRNPERSRVRESLRLRVTLYGDEFIYLSLELLGSAEP